MESAKSKYSVTSSLKLYRFLILTKIIQYFCNLKLGQKIDVQYCISYQIESYDKECVCGVLTSSIFSIYKKNKINIWELYLRYSIKGDDSKTITVNIIQLIMKSEQTQDNKTPTTKVLQITGLKEMVTVDKSIISQSSVSLKCGTTFKYHNKREDSISRVSWQCSLARKESQKL